MLYFPSVNPIFSSFGTVPPVAPPNSPPGGGGFTGQAPPQQHAPPDLPPVDSGGGGGGGGGGFGFPHIPPMPHRHGGYPYVILDTNVTETYYPMHAICMLAGYREPCDIFAYNCPPPTALGLYIYPIQFVEVQTRRYYQPPAMCIQVPSIDQPDHTEKYYKKRGWKARPTSQHRFPMFMVNNSLIGFSNGWNDSAYGFRWHLLSTGAGVTHTHPTYLMYQTIEALKMFFLTHNRGAPPEVVERWEQANIPGVTPVVCLTGNWDVNYHPDDVNENILKTMFGGTPPPPPHWSDQGFFNEEYDEDDDDEDDDEEPNGFSPFSEN